MNETNLHPEQPEYIGPGCTDSIEAGESGLILHAKAEMALAGIAEGTSIYNATLEIIKHFSSEGHSGASATWHIGMLNRLLQFQPLTPLTGEEPEWMEIHSGLWQNKRCSEVFKDAEGRTYWIYGQVFSDDGGETWFTSTNGFVDITFPWTHPGESERVLLPSRSEREVNHG